MAASEKVADFLQDLMNKQMQQRQQRADAAAAALLAEEEAESRAKQGRRGRKGKAKVKGAEAAAQPSAGALPARGGGASTPCSAAHASTSGRGALEVLCGPRDSRETKSAVSTVPAEKAHVAEVIAAQREKKRLKEKQRKERQNQAKLGEARDAVRAHLGEVGGGGGSGALEEAVDQLRRMLRRQASMEDGEEELERLLAAGAAKLKEVQKAERAAAESRTLEACEGNRMRCAGAGIGDVARSSVQPGGLGLSVGPSPEERASTQPSGEDLCGLARADGEALRGASASASSSAATDGEDSVNLCVVCYERRKNTVFLPCKHMCTCAECTAQLAQSEGFLCPVCRVRVTDYLAGIFI
eukprot:gene11297-13347_t